MFAPIVDRLAEENKQLRASLDLAGDKIHQLECENVRMVKYVTVIESSRARLAREVTRHNKRCRQRKRQVKRLLLQRDDARDFNQTLLDEQAVLWKRFYEDVEDE